MATTALLALAPAAASAEPFTFDQGSPGYGADLAVAEDGAAWLATPEAAGNAGVKAVRIARRAPDGNVRLVARIKAPSGRTFFEPRVAAGGPIATVAWTRAKGSGELRVQAVRCTASGCGKVQTLGRAQRIKTRATPAVDSRGRAFVLWRGTSSKGLRMQWSITSNGRFGKAHTLGTGGNDIAAVAPASGTFVAAWADHTGLRVAQRRAGREMSSPQRLTTSRAAGTQLVQAGRELLVAWYAGGGDAEGEPGAGHVFAATRAAGAARFGTPQRVFEGNGRNVELAANPSGRAVLAFADAGSTPGSTVTSPTYAAVREAGGQFGVPALLATDSPLYAAPAAAVTTGGTATVAWTRTTQPVPAGPNASHVLAAAAQPGAGFGAPVELGAGQTPLAGAAAQSLVVWSTGGSWLGVAG